MFRMKDEKGGDDKVLCVPSDDPRQEHLRDIHHLPEFDRWRSSTSSRSTRTLEPGKSVEGATWVGRAEAEREIKASYQRAQDEEEVEEAEEKVHSPLDAAVGALAADLARTAEQEIRKKLLLISCPPELL